MIEFHADDYGLYRAQSRLILDCIENGRVSGISLMPNSPHLGECMEMLAGALKNHLRKQTESASAGDPYAGIKLTVHLNFVEGRALSGPSVLTDKDGIFRISFPKLLFVSWFSPLRAEYKAALEREISAQIHACLPYFGSRPLRLDGHCHYQMVPVFFDAMMDVCRREGLSVSYIRIPYEEMSIYKKHGKNFEHDKKINLVKVFLLNRLTARAERKYPDWFRDHPRVPFAGVRLSGSMTKHNVDLILQDFETLSGSSPACWGEMLFHPGAVLEPGDKRALTSKDDYAFLTSPLRAEEAEALKRQ